MTAIITKQKNCEIMDPSTQTAVIMSYLDSYMKNFPANISVVIVLPLCKTIFYHDETKNTNMIRLLKYCHTLLILYNLFHLFLLRMMRINNAYHIIIQGINYFVGAVFFFLILQYITMKQMLI